MGRRVFVSVLGTGFYGECKYCTDSFTSSNTRFIQQATIEYLNVKNSWTESDCIYIVLTKKAKETNWENEQENRINPSTKQEERYIRLKEILSEMELPCSIRIIDIPDGRDETEMWTIFHRLFDVVEPNDELFFDLTHSFRYLPMLVLVLGNYARFLRDTKVRHISYGNYEARNVETNLAPLMDVLPLATLQSWTFAAADLIQNGNARQLKELSGENALTPMLRQKNKDNLSRKIASADLGKTINKLNEIMLEFQLCKGKEILSGESISSFRSLVEDMLEPGYDAVLSVLPPIIERINDSLNVFEEDSLANGFHAARWCFEHQLYQQSLTILNENLTTAFCRLLGVDEKDYPIRECASKSLAKGSINLNDRNDWTRDPRRQDANGDGETRFNKAKCMVQNKVDCNDPIVFSFLRYFHNDYYWLKGRRNSYNHASMTNYPFREEDLPRLKKIIAKCLNYKYRQ